MKKAISTLILGLLCLVASAQTSNEAAELAQEQAFQRERGFTLTLDLSKVDEAHALGLQEALSQNSAQVIELEMDATTDRMVFVHKASLSQKEVRAMLKAHSIPKSAILSYQSNSE